MCNEEETETPAVSWVELWPEMAGLLAAVVIPLILLLFDLAERKPDLFHRSGTVALFIVAVLQFKGLSDLNRKHVNNAVRAKTGKKIKNISVERTHLSWFTLLVATYAAAISAFGDKFVHALIMVLYT